MRRREFLSFVGGVAATLPLAAQAQQAERVRRVGVLMPSGEQDPLSRPRIKAFTEALTKLGWIEGRNLQIDYRWQGSDRASLGAAVSDLLAIKPDLILATNTPALAVSRQQTRKLPIVFLNVTDPVGQGFVSSLARPGGNVTGFTSFEFSMAGKWIELIKEVAPHVRRLALLFNPVTAPYMPYYIRAFEASAPNFSVSLHPAPIHNATEIERAIGSFSAEIGGGLFVAPDVTTAANRELIISLSIKHRLPAIFAYGYFAKSGGLIGYGVDIVDFFRRAAAYVDRILKGADPSSLPVQQPVKFELVINLKTAKTLGLTVPPTLLARADEVIE